MRHYYQGDTCKKNLKSEIHDKMLKIAHRNETVNFLPGWPH